MYMNINATIIILLVIYVLCYVMAVEITNGSQTWQPVLNSDKVISNVKLADSSHDVNRINKTRLKIPRPSSPGKNKIIVNATESKAQSTTSYRLAIRLDDKRHTTQKKNLTGKIVKTYSPEKKQINVTEDKTKPTKGSIRMGNRGKQQNWPKVQKRRLRDKSRTTNAIRLTKMNMMQMDDESPQNKPIFSPFSGDANLNEVLSPYTLKQQMTRIASKFTNANITIEVIGRTLEYNDIVLLKITKSVIENSRFRADDRKYEDDAGQKKIIFIVHGLSVMGMYAIDCLAEENEFVRLVSYYLEHLDKFDIFLIPMANPDGYGFKVEMWNKNLSPQDACPGVALDRNFDIAWNSSRVISSCSQQYPGPTPFSEPETRAIRDIMHRYSNKIIAYIHVHAGTYSPEVFKGDAVLYPRGYTDVQSDDDKYIDLKGEIDEVMRKASFQIYTVTVDTLHNWYGRVTGTSVDYASTVYGIPYAMEFVMQLYDDGKWSKVPSAEATSNHVVVEVWKRVIDVVMDNIWNSFHSNEL